MPDWQHGDSEQGSPRLEGAGAGETVIGTAEAAARLRWHGRVELDRLGWHAHFELALVVGGWGHPLLDRKFLSASPTPFDPPGDLGTGFTRAGKGKDESRGPTGGRTPPARESDVAWGTRGL